MPAENYEEMAMMNSELRFITVELMKIAHERKIPFEQVLEEYFSNAYKLKRKLMTLHYPKAYKFRMGIQRDGLGKPKM